MNYLGLIGLLGLTGEPGGRPIQSAGQIADLGGGALMAAFGVMAALRERERSGEGQIVDVSMTDGSLVLARDGRRAVPLRRRGAAARRGPARPAASSATCPTRPPTAGSRCAALEPKFWRAFCDGVGRGPSWSSSSSSARLRGLA